MDVGAWWATVHGVAKSRTRLSDFTFTFRWKEHEIFRWVAIIFFFLAGIFYKQIDHNLISLQN